MKIAAFALVVLMALAVAVSAQAPEPWAVTNRTLGGGALNQYTPGVDGGAGLNNIGLLVRTWGRVTMSDTVNKFFYIDDGSGVTDSTGNIGIRVSYDNLAAGNTIAPPSVTDFVVVTGISSTFANGQLIHRNLLPRRQADIAPVAEP